ncbi:siderophore-interacting protein [Rhizobiales bacterium RZME27]|uniref:Siderophore-interacting protein n=1 Tax=Endobacterium cereale TaxID=2663029 RepID=A0A6A8A6I9_9HYPH|nr:siderophore-interacting protein [Endobacterium cereale]MEB2844720.1 siderophore-interacting protein [Endobacterium cereale]MQY45457.1 siderophore-interacting protein [Endobacterium cereale]
MAATYQTEGRIVGTGAAALEALKARAVLWDMALEDDGTSLCVWNSKAQICLEGEGGTFKLTSPEERLLRTLQDSVTEMLESSGLSIQWDKVEEGALAPGLSLMTVTSVSRRSPGYLRVRLEGSDAERFATGSLHFRILIGPRGRNPIWPRTAANGRTVWPEGEDALHKPVYTTIAAEDNWLEFDIFRHQGSPTSDWADSNPIGETVGLMGPGGGGCPASSELLLFGDETAMPAISRMLAAAPGKVKAYLQVSKENLCELAGDDRVVPVDNLVEALECCETPATCHVWFAGHCDAAKAARTCLLARGFGKRDFTAVSYWS